MRLFVFGYGYTASVLGARLKAKGWSIAGTTRSQAKADAMKAEGVDAYLFGPAPMKDAKAALAGTTHLLISVPPDSHGDPVLHAHRADIAALRRELKWIGYISTTGVYGDRGGDWVDENAALTPATDRGRRRVEAEREWLGFGAIQIIPTMTFRFASIYGPGRNPLIAFRDGTARHIVKKGQVFSRIHVEDAVSVLESSIAQPRAGGIYNVCDDEPCPPSDVTIFAAGLMGVEPPPPEELDRAAPGMTEIQQSFFVESKRVRNDRIKRELGVALQYPTYREGLTALLPTV